MISRHLNPLSRTPKRIWQCRRSASSTANPSGEVRNNPKWRSTGFYIAALIMPVGIFVSSQFKSADGTPLLTKFIQARTENQQEIERRNTVHEAAAEQAAADRHLFSTAEPSRGGFEMRYPEIFNRSSPSNVQAGQGGADLSALMELYTRKNEKAEREKLERQNAGKIRTIYDDTTDGIFPSWVPVVGNKGKGNPGPKE